MLLKLGYVTFLHQIRKLLLNLTLGEPLSLVKKLPCFYELKHLDVQIVISLHLNFHDMVNCIFLNVFRIEFCRVQVPIYLWGVQERWKIWLKQLHVKDKVQVKKCIGIFGWNWGKTRPDMNNCRYNSLLPFFPFACMVIWPLLCQVNKAEMVQSWRMLQVRIYEAGSR